MADDVKGTLEVDEDVADPKDPKKTKKVEVTFLYVELKPKNDRGGGPRGIKIHRKGSEKGSQQYKLDPNPHDNTRYNKEQKAFYKEVAQDLVTHYYKDGKKFPRYGTRTVTALGVTYKLIAW